MTGLVSRRHVLAVGLVLGLGSGCVVRESGVPRISLRVKKVVPLNVSLLYQRLGFKLELVNGGPGLARIARVHYAIEVFGGGFVAEPWLSGDIGELIDVPQNERHVFAVERTVTLSTLAVLLAGRASAGSLRLHGYVIHADRVGRSTFDESVPIVDVDLRPLKDAKAGL